MTASEINDFESSRLLLLPDVPIDELIEKPMSIRSLNIMIENLAKGRADQMLQGELRWIHAHEKN
jgi:hypothetical protein